MRLRHRGGHIGLLAVVIGTTVLINGPTMAQNNSAVPPPPAYDVTAEEFASLKKLGTAAAMVMFLARNPEHRLAEEALNLLRSSRLDRSSTRLYAPDQAMFIAFADAVAQDTPAAYLDFAARYPGQTLANLALQLAGR